LFTLLSCHLATNVPTNPYKLYWSLANFRPPEETCQLFALNPTHSTSEKKLTGLIFARAEYGGEARGGAERR